MDDALVLDRFLTRADTISFDFAPMVKTGEESSPADVGSDAGAFTALPHGPSPWPVQAQESVGFISQASLNANPARSSAHNTFCSMRADRFSAASLISPSLCTTANERG